MTATIAIVTHDRDLHGPVIARAVEQRHDARCHVIAGDRICGSAALSWSNDAAGPAALPTRDGGSVDPRRLQALWWRRFCREQSLPAEVDDPSHARLIHNDSERALEGCLELSFGGAWVSHPLATRRAANQLVQLQAAREAGFSVPRTLVSQDPMQIRRFCESLAGEVIVKDIGGSRVASVVRRLRPSLLEDDEVLGLVPTVYQQLVPGRAHIRAHAFGQTVLAARIDSPHLDWRPDLNVPMRPYEIDATLAARIGAVLRRLDLRMGIFDFKLTPEGEIVWLEVNPQGQFLFIEGLCGLPLAAAMADFLVGEAERVAGRSSVRLRPAG